MTKTTHVFRVAEARRIKHPALINTEKHHFLVRASELPIGISNEANARDPVGLNRSVYREVKRSLLAENTTRGSFDFMNKGITIIASSVSRNDDGTYEVVVEPGQGIVDGGHTYAIVTGEKDNPNLPEEQYVDVRIFTGVTNDLITDIARGLNTGIQVKLESLDELDGKYEWVKEELKSQTYFDKLAWNETDIGEYDVQDLICFMECFNIFKYPASGGNTEGSTKHPVHAYSSPKTVVKKFSVDAETPSKDAIYPRLRPILKDILYLYDSIRGDFYDTHLKNGGKPGKLDIMEKAGKEGKHTFLFNGQKPQEYRLTKGASLPILAAFRVMVQVNSQTQQAEWSGNFDDVLKLWNVSKADLVAATHEATREYSHKPEILGKSGNHWGRMFSILESKMLRLRLEKLEGKAA